MSSMKISEILAHLPHRYPFLLVDRVLSCEPGKSLVALKNVSFNEPYFVGHFPTSPVMPAVLVLEALAQATGILAFRTTESIPSGKSLYYFVGVDKARFKKPVVPGDQLILTVEVIRTVRDVWKFSGLAEVDGTVVASATLMCAEREIDE